MNTNQIYTIVNSAVDKAIGDSGITAIDTQSLISLGNVVLDSSTNTEAFLNTLAQRIGRTIYRFRDYNNKFKDMLVSDMEWGAILQKIRVEMPVAESDEMYGLTDGVAVDHYVVAKPKAHQKLFVTRTPYQFKITIQRETLKEAFLSAEAMGSFIALVFGEVRNAIELSLESLGRLTLSAAISEASQASQTINLVTDYNADTGSTLTAATALYNADYLIVICSTNTKKSTWVEREIEVFLQNHTMDRILTVLADGEPAGCCCMKGVLALYPLLVGKGPFVGCCDGDGGGTSILRNGHER